MRILAGVYPVLLLVFVSCFSADRYVDKNASGSNNGASWTDAWESFDDIDWGDLNPGDTLFISGGTESVTYDDMLEIRASGEEGNPIVVTIGQQPPHNGKVIIEDPNDPAGLVINNESWVTVSGRVGSGSDQNIVIRRHGNDEIRLRSITGVVIEYLEVGPNMNDDAILVEEYITSGNVIRHCDIHDFYDYGILVGRPNGDADAGIIHDKHLIIEHNEIYNMGHDAIHAAAYAGGMTIRHNHIHTQPEGDNINYSDVYVDGMHLRGFYHLTVESNEIHDLWASDGMNAYIYLECDVSQQSNEDAHDMYIYNNVIYETNHTSAARQNSRGIQFNPRACRSVHNIEISNNTIVDTRVWGLMTSWFQIPTENISNVRIINNLIYNNDQRSGGTSDRISFTLQDLHPSVTTGSVGDTPVPDIVWDYNLVDALNARATCRYGTGDPSPLIDYAAFFNASGCDRHGVHSDPSFVQYSVNGVNQAAQLQLSEDDRAASNRGTESDRFNDDFMGTIRPLGSGWDIGAFEGASNRIFPDEPPNLRIHK